MKIVNTNQKKDKRLSRKRSELAFGLSTASVAALFALFVIPSGIVLPDSINHLPLSPNFIPYVATGLIFIFALLHAIESLKRPAKKVATAAKATYHLNWFPRAIAITLCLLGYYFLPERIGLLAVSIFITGGLMYLGGERSKLVLIGGSLLLPTLVFLFFTRIAQVPVPLGFFE